MKVQLATPADVPSWLEVVREVEPLFGPMPDFEATLLRKIEQRAAVCVRSAGADGSTPVAGGMLLGGTRDHAWIRWLAVRSAARGAGIGQCLVEAAIKRMSSAKVISLDTFREENVAGWPARRLYARMGFIAGPLTGDQGALRQRFELRRG
jgi:ribosomal protein S18 acetylase RimI-like enzyme